MVKLRQTSTSKTSKKSKPFQLLRFSKQIITLMLAEVALFTVAVLVIFGIAGNEPTTLITEFFKFWGIEGGALGATKIAETIVENIPRRKEKQKSVDSTDETAI